MLPFVAVGLKTIEDMEICDTTGRGIVMRCAKNYGPEKMGKIIRVAQSFPWWQKNPTAAFMKAVGMVNREEKHEKSTS